jgi:hypothetical protein
MTSSQIKKAFLNKFDELSTVIDIISESETENLVIVVPEGAALFSSPLNLKILARIVTNLGKLVIFITEDEYGYKTIQQASMVVVNKFSQVTSDLWEVVMNRKISAIKKQNIQRRDDGLIVEMVEEKGEIEVLKGDAVDTQDAQGTGNIEANEEEFGFVDSSDELSKVTNNYDSNEDLMDKGAEASPIIKEIKGIKLLQGEDVATYSRIKDGSYAKIELEKITYEMTQKQADDDSSFRKSISSGDFSRLARVKPKKGLLSRFFKKANFDDDIPTAVSNIIEDRESTQERVRSVRISRRFLFAIVAVVVMIIALGVFWLFSGTKVVVRIGLKKEEVLTTEKVRLNFETEQVDVDNKILPAIAITVDSETVSGSAEASGTGVKGTKSTGYIYIFNKTENEVTLVAGTKLLNITTSLEYTIPSAIVLPASTRASDQTLNPSRKNDITIEASGFGAEYDISVTDNASQLRIIGYDGVSIVEAKVQTDIKGGTSTEITSVAKQNVDALAQSLTGQLRTKASNKLDLAIPADYILIQASVKFEITETKANPLEGQEAPNKTFDLSLRAKIVGFAVKRSDIIDMLSGSSNSAGASKVKDVQDFTFANFQEGDSFISLELNAEGSLKSNIKADDIRNIIYNLPVKDAEQALKNNIDIESVKIDFYPLAIPEGFRVVPGSQDRVGVEFIE